MADPDALQFGPVVHVLAIVRVLDRDRILAPLIDARIDRVEHAADQKRPPDEVGAGFLRDPFDTVEGEIGPGARIVEEDIDSRHWGIPRQCRCGGALRMDEGWPHPPGRAPVPPAFTGATGPARPPT